MLKKSLKKLIIPVVLGISSMLANAQDQGPVRILIGFAAGGNGDIIARMMADELRPILGRNVIVENKPGAGGRLAAQALKTYPADGTSYLLAPDSWAIFPTITTSEAQLRYNLKTDFAPVARIVSFPLGFFVAESANIHSLKEYVEKAKSDPGLAMYGSSGSGGISELLGMVMSKEFGFKVNHVPFKGVARSRPTSWGHRFLPASWSPVMACPTLAGKSSRWVSWSKSAGLLHPRFQHSRNRASIS